jgi:ABC-type transport system involved in cytochrome bd biosynthesis fused ATPase/permease subunit
VRAAPRVAPLLERLRAPRRREVSGGGVGIELPAPVRIDRLTFGYDPDAAPVCRDVSVEWPESSALVLEGPNGSGKSTLLRLLLGLRAPSEGTIEIGGVGVERIDAAAFRRAVGYLPQQPYLGEPTVTVRDAVRLLEPDAADEAIVAALDAVGLTPMLEGRADEPLDVAVGELSSGQRQRLALGRALLRDASMYLLDEPDANLDRAGIALVATVIGDLVRRGKMVAIAAHTTELAHVAERRVRLP